jgi:predicted transposase/invertase (TIGR01784 family)
VKTDILFYYLLQSFPQIFFELIGQPINRATAYQFTSAEVKQKAFRFDGLFLPVVDAPELPIYFVEVQFQKKPKFYARLFAEIFLYLYQYNPPSTDWQAIIIYRRRSTETPALPRYRELMAHRVQCIYLDELGQTDNQLLGIGIVQLVVESKNKAAEKARQLMIRAEQELPDAQNQQQILELIETIIVGKFPNLSREEIEAMLNLNELKHTRVYQDALQEGLDKGKLEGKLEGIPGLVKLGLTVEQIAGALQLDVEIVREVVARSPN